MTDKVVSIKAQPSARAIEIMNKLFEPH